ncbi:hypothetical protein ACAW74_15385 [Fibrella sp. WM1]|uniref:hypothetical protein n=1 Tax=Fibrella musci TaxID=3242485 RepID=UPI00351FE104
MDLYAKIYLYSSAAKPQVDELLFKLTINLKSIDWSVAKNDDFNSEKAIQFPNGFLFFPYMIEVDPSPSADPVIYLNEIATLLNLLWKEGISAVTAANFENQLPEQGGYKNISILFNSI